ncbi:squamosa promoter-binding-like protein 1 [Pyrus ussuriensis x Pyrus communis]|uniref:Squamosa promoter-binding-like protein 1 n=1 Tax=Pyrus ussuriensis x Pyrus communis TaxID=2448454 RepID=A0A5N5F8U7_9ROSA|nr:squamosa promoter-binding-like protein 1 [Pyrus ussuriensis x Pyrus communis]
MESEFGGKARNFGGVMVPDLKVVGKKSLEWDLNDFKWDGDLFTASPLNSTPSDGRSRQLFPARPETPSDAGLSNSSSSGSDNISPGNEKDKRELEKRRRDVFVENRELNDEAASLNLKLGGQTYPIMEEEVQTGKKTKTIGTTSNRAVCQVEDCKADLSNAKDYHRRHKVCDMHSKATKALVGSVMQRFCQQCSRFHALQEFDEGKRSCRRRLAGHNRRRRKAHPDTAINGGSLNNESGSSYLLISLLRILSNMHSSSSDQTKDQDVVSHLLRSLANVAGTADGRNISTLLQGSQGLFNSGTSVQTARKVLDMNAGVNTEDPLRSKGHCPILPASRDSSESKSVTPEAASRRFQLNDIDLNNTYDDSQDYVENLGNSHVPASPGTASLGFPSWMQRDSHKTSPPQTSGNSDLTSTQSPSSSSGEAQSHTDRIVFKLFGKDPNELPLALRSQILDWLSHSPTNIESYIRPGCIILTIYLRLEKSTWEEFCCHLGSSLKTLLDAADDPFWRTGWVYTRVQDFVAFTYNGEVVLDTPLPLKSNKSCRISCIKPIAISLSERAEFVVKGFNLSSSTTRLLCALEGKYLAQETCYDLLDDADSTVEDDEQQCLKFSCSIPNVTGRGFIEVEDHGLSSSFFPFIVAEQEVCSEICMLEDVIEVSETDDDIQSGPEKVEAKNQALDFIHELGWLLHRSRVKFRLGQLDPNLDTFPYGRFRLLMEFSIDHDWCAVVKKLLGILFDGTVDAGEHPSLESALLDTGLLHRAVRINSRRMVEFLLRFVPGLTGSERKEQVDRDGNSFLFKPDVVGPMGLTPLHIAASTDGCEQVLDALTDDPGKVGIKAWKNARDSTGLTPYDYACLRSHYSYVQIVQRKISKTLESGHVVLDIPGLTLDRNGKQKQSDADKSSRVASLETEKNEIKAILRHCRLCEQKPAHSTTRSLVYRPAMLSMVIVAAVCVCVALLFKSTPEVLFVFEPFRWEHLKFGSS